MNTQDVIKAILADQYDQLEKRDMANAIRVLLKAAQPRKASQQTLRGTRIVSDPIVTVHCKKLSCKATGKMPRSEASGWACKEEHK